MNKKEIFNKLNQNKNFNAFSTMSVYSAFYLAFTEKDSEKPSDTISTRLKNKLRAKESISLSYLLPVEKIMFFGFKIVPIMFIVFYSVFGIDWSINTNSHHLFDDIVSRILDNNTVIVVVFAAGYVLKWLFSFERRKIQSLALETVDVSIGEKNIYTPVMEKVLFNTNIVSAIFLVGSFALLTFL